MKVVLQRYNQWERPIRKALELRPREDVFWQALLGMKVPQEAIDRIKIVIEFRDMIPHGAMGVEGDNEFRIYLRSFGSANTFNETVAHELKHIAIEILKPHKFRTDGKSKGPYKWEELDCTRAEKKWGKLEYFEVLTTGENE